MGDMISCMLRWFGDGSVKLPLSIPKITDVPDTVIRPLKTLSEKTFIVRDNVGHGRTIPTSMLLHY